MMLHDFDVMLSVIDIVICLVDMALVAMIYRARLKPSPAKKVSPYAVYRRARKRRTGL